MFKHTPFILCKEKYEDYEQNSHGGGELLNIFIHFAWPRYRDYFFFFLRKHKFLYRFITERCDKHGNEICRREKENSFMRFRVDEFTSFIE